MNNRRQSGSAFVWLLSVFLAVFMTFEVAHGHSGSDTGVPVASTQCQLCMIAHVPTISQNAWLTSFVLDLIGHVSIGEPSLGSRAVVVTTYIRPPPAKLLPLL